MTTNLAVSSSANTPNVITPSYQDTTFTLPEKDNSNAEINITKPTDYPQVDWISNDYWIFEEVHEWTAVGYRHDYYVAVKADGSSTQTGTVYLFDSRSKQMTTVEKGQFVQLAGNDGDRFYNSGRTISFLNVNQTSGSYYKHYNVLYSLYNKYADNEQPWYNSVSEFIPILGPLVVHYQDQTTGQEIISSTEIAMMTGNSYDVTNPPKIDGYTYVGVKNNTTGHISNYNDATVGQQWDEHFGFSQLSKNSYDVYTTYTYEGKNTEGVGKFKLETYVDGLIYHTDEMDSMNPVRIMLPDGGYIDLANPSLQGENDVTFLYKKNPDDVETTTESKTVKRTIKYIDKTTGEAIPSNLAKPVEQDVTLTRTKSTNKTTGKVTYGDWTVASGSWDKVVSPDLTNYGYTAPDKASVAAVTVDGNTENSDVKVYYGHATTTITPDTPQKPDTPINPNDPNSPKYTEDQTDVTKDASQTVHYTGAGDKTPSDKVQTQKNAFTRTVTIDKVTGKTVSATPWTGSKTFGTETTPVVDGYHADKKVAGGLTATPENPNVEDTVTYAANGKIIPVDPNGNKIPDVPNPTYPTDPTDPTKVTPDEPVPDIPGYTPEVPTVTPSDPGKDTPVVYYTSPAAIVNFIDEDYVNAQGKKVPTQIGTSGGLTGKIGETIIYSGYDAKLQSYLDKGYVLDKSEYPTKDVYDNDDKTLQTFNVYLKHGTTTVTPDNPKNPNTPINPKDPDGPKYTEDQTKVKVPSTQTITYTGAGDKTPAKDVQTGEFDRTVTIDKVTGKTISSTPWTYTVNGKTTTGESLTYGTKDTPVVDGYHADKKVAGGLTATPENPNVEDTVTYAANGKIIPVDPNGNKIPDAPTPTYPTDPTDPTKVVPDEPVPDIPGYTPETPTVTPENPGKNTNVPYTKNPTTPTEDKSSFKVVYVDQSDDGAVLKTDSESGKYGDQITYTTADTIKSLEDKGYVLVSDGFTGKAGSEFSDSNNGKTYTVVLKHGTTTVTPSNPQTPGQPINPNDPNGPKYTKDQTDVTRDATQTITYHYSDGSQPDT